jgi:hypothetical protein
VLDVELECLRNSQATEDRELPFALSGKRCLYKSQARGKLANEWPSNSQKRQSSV